NQIFSFPHFLLWFLFSGRQQSAVFKMVRQFWVRFICGIFPDDNGFGILFAELPRRVLIAVIKRRMLWSQLFAPIVKRPFPRIIAARNRDIAESRHVKELEKPTGNGIKGKPKRTTEPIKKRVNKHGLKTIRGIGRNIENEILKRLNGTVSCKRSGTGEKQSRIPKRA
ncbi:MAG: hypothetical protein GY866_35015, partial [Proteobacteria bacterium]|nr:hypothetical protein [Pseudomonadota bacterium]